MVLGFTNIDTMEIKMRTILMVLALFLCCVGCFSVVYNVMNSGHNVTYIDEIDPALVPEDDTDNMMMTSSPQMMEDLDVEYDEGMTTFTTLYPLGTILLPCCAALASLAWIYFVDKKR
jgi:hypothetical protein